MNLKRFVAIAISSMVGASMVVAQPGPPGKGGDPRPPPPAPRLVDDVDRPTLSARVIEEALTPYLAGVRSCYVGRVRSARAEHLRLELVIERGGAATLIGVGAPGTSGPERRGLDACLRGQIARWHFPVRGGATVVVIPFYFQRTVAPGAGAQASCWSPRGCPAPRDHSDKEQP